MTEQKKNFRRVILSLASKYQYNRKHASFVEKTALKLFDSLKDTYMLDDNERILLSHASLLHDIGSFINEAKHNKHTKYIIDTDKDLNKYPENQRSLMSLIAYNHRKKLHKDTLLLSKRSRESVIKLSAILRIADSLDFIDKKVVVKNIFVDASEVKISVEGILPERLIERLTRKKDLFTEVFKLNVTLSI